MLKRVKRSLIMKLTRTKTKVKVTLKGLLLNKTKLLKLNQNLKSLEEVKVQVKSHRAKYLKVKIHKVKYQNRMQSQVVLDKAA